MSQYSAAEQRVADRQSGRSERLNGVSQSHQPPA